MDTTYKLCDNEMPLTVLEVVDCFGRGRIAGYELILSESTDLLCAALSGLKSTCKKLDVKCISVQYSQFSTNVDMNLFILFCMFSFQ